MLWAEAKAALYDVIDARELEYRITYEKQAYQILWKHVEAYAAAALGEVEVEGSEFEEVRSMVDHGVAELFKKTRSVHLGLLYEQHLKQWIAEGPIALQAPAVA